MSGTPSPRSPLASLVLFVIALALAASLFAAVHYAVIDQPEQKKELIAPSNNRDIEGCCWEYERDEARCYSKQTSAVYQCNNVCDGRYPNYRWLAWETVARNICYNWCDKNIDVYSACTYEAKKKWGCLGGLDEEIEPEMKNGMPPEIQNEMQTGVQPEMQPDTLEDVR